MNTSYPSAFVKNFLGQSPDWYKVSILVFLIINPLLFFFVSKFFTGWLLVIEFIFTLVMTLKCYPLQAGGLLILEAVIIGMTTAENIWLEVTKNIEVLLLLVFMVAGIHFMKDLLLFIFTKILLRIRSKITLSVTFCCAAAFLSAFLDALTVIAVVISVAMGFLLIYHRFISEQGAIVDNDDKTAPLSDDHKQTLEQFRSFLRSLLMHAGIGTALGGIMTMVGEPQNLIIAKTVGWGFSAFFLHMLPVTVPVFIFGIATCILVERFKVFGYGEALPEDVRIVLSDNDIEMTAKRTQREKVNLVVQALIGVWLIAALALHLAEVGLIGLSVIVLATSFCGIVEEQNIGKAFQEALPFAALLTVFFSVVAIIIDQQLFAPLIDFLLQSSEGSQQTLFYLFNGVLSSISDNVFVGSIFINEIHNAFSQGIISRDKFEILAVAVNAGTNLLSIATPNGQAAFLFLLTSAVAPLVRLSYSRMVIMALPYTLVLSVVGYLCVEFILSPLTAVFF
ncbi:sodium/proton antiporter NhaB [Acerihabitans sp. TG2]|uniref:sodium/proton antiporter NhaB n=1 Tax=Acerihabitans sp. TG2 TaxID=3096008 RepID=UPI002B23DAE0|nr:sodium/proton antiporter NhaB [Acerihabitans sp. TG2]MEA9390115.1 sodium/proton antiporter NhaB [Acerihabitans sp. TG2]